MTRMLALLISIVLLVTPATPVAASPAAASPPVASPVLPPDTPAVAPAVEVPAPPDLTRLGRLKIRGIGLDVPVYRWSCDGSDLPNRALRWGCTGANNQFIVGHAYGVFRPYYLAWKYKRFKVGMVATFTKPSGALSRYKLVWVRLVPKSYIWNGMTGDVWAYGPTSTPSFTLQTCWGATNAYRIVTRWVKV